MSIDRPPAFSFYPRDFAGDGRVEAMTTEAVGAYILILCKAWFEDPVGSIPDDDNILARWARLPLARWRKVRDSVLACFQLRSDGRWHQKRMQQVDAEMAQRRGALQERARKAAMARWGDGGKEDMPDTHNDVPEQSTDDTLAVLKHSSSSAQAMREECLSSSSSSSDANTTPASQQPRARTRTHERARERLADWLGPHAGAVRRMAESAAHPPTWAAGILGLYGPDGTDERIWGGLSPPDRAEALAVALDRYAAEAKPYNGRLFRRFLETVIHERSRNGHDRDHGGGAAPTAQHEAPGARATGRSKYDQHTVRSG